MPVYCALNYPGCEVLQATFVVVRKRDDGGYERKPACEPCDTKYQIAQVDAVRKAVKQQRGGRRGES